MARSYWAQWMFAVKRFWFLQKVIDMPGKILTASLRANLTLHPQFFFGNYFYYLYWNIRCRCHRFVSFNILGLILDYKIYNHLMYLGGKKDGCAIFIILFFGWKEYTENGLHCMACTVYNKEWAINCSFPTLHCKTARVREKIIKLVQLENEKVENPFLW